MTAAINFGDWIICMFYIIKSATLYEDLVYILDHPLSSPSCYSPSGHRPVGSTGWLSFSFPWQLGELVGTLHDFQKMNRSVLYQHYVRSRLGATITSSKNCGRRKVRGSPCIYIHMSSCGQLATDTREGSSGPSHVSMYTSLG